MSAIGDNIKKLREENKFTQASLAAITGIDEKYISSIECGKRVPGKKIINQ